MTTTVDPPAKRYTHPDRRQGSARPFAPVKGRSRSSMGETSVRRPGSSLPVSRTRSHLAGTARAPRDFSFGVNEARCRSCSIASAAAASEALSFTRICDAIRDRGRSGQEVATSNWRSRDPDRRARSEPCGVGHPRVGAHEWAAGSSVSLLPVPYRDEACSAPNRQPRRVSRFVDRAWSRAV